MKADRTNPSTLIAGVVEDAKRLAELEVRLLKVEGFLFIHLIQKTLALLGLGLVVGIPTVVLAALAFSAWLHSATNLPIWQCYAWTALGGLLASALLFWGAKRTWRDRPQDRKEDSHAEREESPRAGDRSDFPILAQ